MCLGHMCGGEERGMVGGGWRDKGDTGPKFKSPAHTEKAHTAAGTCNPKAKRIGEQEGGGKGKKKRKGRRWAGGGESESGGPRQK